MSKVIIAIHGLGNKPPKEQLLDWGKMAIKEGMQLEQISIKKPPKFELVYWADLLYNKPQTLTEEDKNSPYFLDEIYTPTPKNYKFESHEFRKYFLDFFKKVIYKIFLGKEYHLRYAFVTQKIIHKYFHELEVFFSGDAKYGSDINSIIKRNIIERLSKVLEKYENDEIFLIAHSMGAIIAFHVLSFINPKIKINTFVTIGAPLGAPFVLSRIAEHSKNVYGVPKPQTPECVQKNWYNFSDIRDQIALDYKLSDDFGANSKGIKCIDQLVTNNYVMNNIANPHKSYGYLRTPEFIDVLVKFLSS